MHDGADTSIAPHAPAAGPTPCRGCGYDLAGLPPAGGCPECNFPIELSLADTGLEHSSPEYLARLHRGVFFVLAGIIAMILLVIASVGATVWASYVGSGSALQSVTLASTILNAVSTLIVAYGWWLFTEPDPAFTGRNDGSRARQIVRISIVVSAALTVLNTAFQLVPGFGAATLPAAPGAAPALGVGLFLAMAVGILSFIAWVVQFFASMLYLRWLAPRIPNARAHARAKTLMWLGPVLYFPGVLLCGIGPLIALVLYWNMLDWIRKDFQRLRAGPQVPPSVPVGVASGRPPGL